MVAAEASAVGVAGIVQAAALRVEPIPTAMVPLAQGSGRLSASFRELILLVVNHLVVLGMVVEQIPLEGQRDDLKREGWDARKQRALDGIDIKTSQILCCDV